MKKISLVMVLALVLSLFVGVGACAEDEIVIGVESLDLTQQFYVYMQEGSAIAAEEEGVTITWKSAESNLDNQIALIENFIQQEVDAIIVDPYDSEGLISVCEKAQAAGIPVISAGNFIDSDAVISCLYNDRQDTYVIGKIIGESLQGEGDVAFRYGAAGNFISDERKGGFETTMAEYPNINYTSYAIGWDSTTAMTTTQDILASNPDTDFIHCFSDGETVGVYQAVEQAGLLDSVRITSYDGNIEASEAVKNGEYLCTLLTGAKRVGYWSSMVAIKAARGEEISSSKLYLKSYFIMNDDLKQQVEDWGIGYEGMEIISPDEGIKLFDEMTGFEY